jgi:hypothetical protein
LNEADAAAKVPSPDQDAKPTSDSESEKKSDQPEKTVPPLRINLLNLQQKKSKNGIDPENKNSDHGRGSGSKMSPKADPEVPKPAKDNGDLETAAEGSEADKAENGTSAEAGAKDESADQDPGVADSKDQVDDECASKKR